MERINGSFVAPDLHGPGKDGFRDGNKVLGIAATIVNAEYMNGVQEEIVRVIESAGLTPSAADNTQLLQAINNIVKGPADKIVRVASTAAINLAAPGANIDGVAMVAGDTFLEKDHATLASRGVYVWNGAAVPATRDPSADTGAELFGGMIIRVKAGTVNADTNWQITNDTDVTVGVTGITFQKVGASSVVTAVSDPTFVDNTSTPASTSWIRGAMSAIATAAGFAYSLTANGYIKFPTWLAGLIIQWGSTSSLAAEAEVLVTFPIAFSSMCKVITSFTYTGARFDSSQVPHVRDKSLTNFYAVNDQVAVAGKTGVIDWFSIGI